MDIIPKFSHPQAPNPCIAADILEWAQRACNAASLILKYEPPYRYCRTCKAPISSYVHFYNRIQYYPRNRSVAFRMAACNYKHFSCVEATPGAHKDKFQCRIHHVHHRWVRSHTDLMATAVPVNNVWTTSSGYQKKHLMQTEAHDRNFRMHLRFCIITVSIEGY